LQEQADEMLKSKYNLEFLGITRPMLEREFDAMVLEQIIQRINNTKQGTNKSTVIGFSMGGLIAQYALRDMENKGLSHQVANYFSYDSPHQGANVPLGLQWLFNEMITDMPYIKLNKDIKKLYNSFTGIAAQQMLVTYATGNYGLPTNSVRETFAQHLFNMGYPQTTANYGISQGRGNNTSGTTNAGVGTQFGFTNGSTIFNGGVAFFLVNMSATVNAVSTTSSSSILRYLFFGLKVATIFGIPVGLYPAIRLQNIKYQSPYPYDDAPGGYENTQAQFDYNFNHLSIFGAASDNGHYGHCFVPLASALDLQNQGYGLSNFYQSNNMYYTLDNNIQSPGQLAGNTLNPATLSPFKSVLTYTSDCGSEPCQSYCGEDKYLSVNNISRSETNNWNEWHEGDFSNQVQLFVQRKILGTSTFPSCSINTDLCDNSAQITGPSNFCNTATFNLSSSFPIQGVEYQWSFPNGTVQITGGQGTPSINVSEVYAGQEVVTCEIINSCGLSSTYTFNTTVGNVLTGTITQSGNNTPMYTTNSISAGPTSVTFQWPGVTGISCYQSSSNPSVSQTGFIYYPSQSKFWFTLSSGQSITVSFSGTGCGGTTIATRSFTVGGHYYVVSPNPASSSINITPSSDAGNTTIESSQITSTTQVSIADVNGNLKRQQQFSSGTANMKISVADLIPGTYFVHIINGNINETHQVIIHR
jgi:hypothetical protein